MKHRVGIYWWSPSKWPSDLRHEVPASLRPWLSQLLASGRIFKNFGDEFSPLSWEIATGRRAVWSPPQKADLFAVGSIIERSADRGSDLAIWGTGARSPEGFSASTDARPAFLAVRGPLTAEVLGITNVPLGDPGLLVGQATLPAAPRRRGQHIFLPHYRTAQTSAGRALLRRAKEKGWATIPASLKPMEVATALAQAQSVTTTSLHGIIFSHALGTPCRLIEPTDGEPTFKYRDYFDSISTPYSPVTAQDAFSSVSTETDLGMALAEVENASRTIPARVDELVASAARLH